MKPHSAVAQFTAAGVRVDEKVDAQRKATLVSLVGAAGKEHWLGFKNFYVITRYNRSPLYALAAYQLSLAIAERRRAGR